MQFYICQVDETVMKNKGLGRTMVLNLHCQTLQKRTTALQTSPLEGSGTPVRQLVGQTEMKIIKKTSIREISPFKVFICCFSFFLHRTSVIYKFKLTLFVALRTNFKFDQFGIKKCKVR